MHPRAKTFLRLCTGMSLALGLLLLNACTHVKGVVLEPITERPVTDARFTIGNPTGVGTFQTFKVDENGRFDFSISPTDENYLFLWDGKGDPAIAIRKIDRSQLNDHMKIYYSTKNRDY